MPLAALPVLPEPATSDALAFADRLTVPFPAANVAELTRASREAVLQLGLRLREHPTWRASVVGHTDARGSREVNLALGTLRARVVAQLLRAAGVPAEQIAVESRGEDEPRSSDNSEEAWNANRRVEIAIRTARSETP
jgi:outer membrane protein OmpA-like peptidoglycan-associated protein